jgi:hypothetical protein
MLAWCDLHALAPYRGTIIGVAGGIGWLVAAFVELKKDKNFWAAFNFVVALIFFAQGISDFMEVPSNIRMGETLDKATNEVYGLSNELVATSNSLAQATNDLAGKVAEANSKTAPRTITPKQVVDFIYLSEDIEKIPITIYAAQSGDDAYSFAMQLREMLTEAKFGIDPNSDQDGMRRDITINTGRPIGQTVATPWVFIFHYGDNGDHAVPLDFDYVRGTNGLCKPRVTYNNDPKNIYLAIGDCLTQIGIPVEGMSSTNGMRPGQYEFFVPPKSF